MLAACERTPETASEEARADLPAPSVPDASGASPEPADRPPAPTGGTGAAMAGCVEDKPGAITAKGVGQVEIGVRGAELTELCPARSVTLRTEFHRGPAYEVGRGVTAFANEAGRIVGVLLERAGPETAGGVGVGDDIAALRKSMSGGGKLCADSGAVGVEAWRQGEPIVFVTDASSRTLGETVRDRFAAGERLSADAKITAVRIMDKSPYCAERPAPARWDRGEGAVGIYPLDGESVTLAVDAQGLAAGAYRVSAGEYASEGADAGTAAPRLQSGRRDGNLFYPDDRGRLRLEMTLPRRRFGPEGDAAVALHREGTIEGPVRIARFQLPD